ncbi:hypothetical protein IKL45_03220 [Candidatus Saccharibacteria bacterium]|nr:hypothetical protein [Candidatus Saccharibacteria bacterium]MBR6122724.1 hypothetical protein [Candidatus Saccharibacteria bacterium]
MEEVKKSKKKNKNAKAEKPAKAKKIEVEEVEEEGIEEEKVEEVEEEVEKVEEPKAEEKQPEKKEEKPEKKEKEEKEEKPKKSKKGLVIFLVALVILVGGAFAAKMILTKTSVATETVKLADDARGFSNYFKEYLTDRAEAEQLFSYSFRELKNEEILNKLTELKDGFSKVSRGVAGNYGKSEYKELAEVMRADADAYLSMVRELRAIMTENYPEEGDRQLAFMRKVEEESQNLRSAVYLARAAFTEDVSGFSSKGVLAFNGNVMVEVGGGVANIFLGDFGNNVVAVSTDDLDGVVKAIDAKELYGFVSSRVVKIGESLRGELESGWFKRVKADVGNTEVKVEKTKISMVMKNVWGMDEELKAQGIKGLMETEKKALAEQLAEAVSGLKGKK